MTAYIQNRGYIQMVHSWKEEPCRYASNYKGKRPPGCGCTPCVQKYVEAQKALGKSVKVSV